MQAGFRPAASSSSTYTDAGRSCGPLFFAWLQRGPPRASGPVVGAANEAHPLNFRRRRRAWQVNQAANLEQSLRQSSVVITPRVDKGGFASSGFVSQTVLPASGCGEPQSVHQRRRPCAHDQLQMVDLSLSVRQPVVGSAKLLPGSAHGR